MKNKKEDVLIARLRKKGSPNTVEFNIDPLDDGDNWFINRKVIKNKTGEVIDYSLFIKKDLFNWSRYYTDTLGWEIDFIDKNWNKHIYDISFQKSDISSKKTDKNLDPTVNN